MYVKKCGCKKVEWRVGSAARQFVVRPGLVVAPELNSVGVLSRELSKLSSELRIEASFQPGIELSDEPLLLCKRWHCFAALFV